MSQVTMEHEEAVTLIDLLERLKNALHCPRSACCR